MTTTFQIGSISLQNMNVLRNDPANKYKLPLFQRPPAPAWDKPEKRDLLIDSVMNGYSINIIHVSIEWNTPNGEAPANLENIDPALIKAIHITDGQQRLRVLNAVMSKANPYTPTTLTGEFETLNGKAIDDWTDEHQTAFYQYPIYLVIHNLEEDILAELFQRLNRPAPLTTMQVNRSKCLPAIEALQESINNTRWESITHKPNTPAMIGLSPASVEMLVIQTAGYIARQREMTQDSLIKWIIGNPVVPTALTSQAIEKALTALEMIKTFENGEKTYKKALKKVNLLTICLVATHKQTKAEYIASAMNAILEPAKKDRTGEMADYFNHCTSATSSKAESTARVVNVLYRMHRDLHPSGKQGKNKTTGTPVPPHKTDEQKAKDDLAHAKEMQAKADAEKAIREAKEKAIANAIATNKGAQPVNSFKRK